MARLGLLGGVALVWAVLTAQQVELWHSELGIWTQAVELAPASPRPLVNRARLEALAGDRMAADRDYRDARALALVRPNEERREALAVIDANRARMAVNWTAWVKSF